MIQRNFTITSLPCFRKMVVRRKNGRRGRTCESSCLKARSTGCNKQAMRNESPLLTNSSKTSALWSISDPRASQLFGLAAFPNRMKLDSLLKTWQDKNQNLEPTWFDSCCEQIMMGARRGFPVIRWTPLREADGKADYTPVLSRIKSRPYLGTVQFDVYFYDLSDPRAIPVTSKMMPLSDLFYKQI